MRPDWTSWVLILRAIRNWIRPRNHIARSFLTKHCGSKNNLDQKHHFQLLAKPPNYADWNYALGLQLNRKFGTAALAPSDMLREFHAVERMIEIFFVGNLVHLESSISS